MGTIRRAVGEFWALVKRNPVRAQAVVVGTIALASAFGLGWTGAQVGAATGFSAVLLAFITETAVTPLEKPVLPAGTDVIVTTPGPTPNETVTV